MDNPDPLDQQARPDLLETEVCPAPLVLMVNVENLEHPDHLENQVHPEHPDDLETEESPAEMEALEHLDLEENLAARVHLVPVVM